MAQKRHPRACPKGPPRLGTVEESLVLWKVLAISESALRKAKVENPRSEAEYIVSSACNIPPLEFFLLKKDKLIPARQIGLIRDALRRRAANEPLQYIFGKAYFRELELQVGPGVLIPRPETEILVDIVLQNCPPKARICDVGTGSGAIPLALAYERNFECVGLDISPAALAYARRNRRKYGLSGVRFLRSDLFSAFRRRTAIPPPFDAITANLPYVTSTEFADLPREIRSFEPRGALEAGSDGLDVIRLFAADAWKYMAKDGFAVIEISPNQKEILPEVILESGHYRDIVFEKDLGGHFRFCRFKSVFRNCK